MPLRDGGLCTAAWTLRSALQPESGRISIDKTSRLLRALHEQADLCGVFKAWRNAILRELDMLLQQRISLPPFERRPSQGILKWHQARGPKGRHRDHDEDLDANVAGDSDHNRTGRFGNQHSRDRNIQLRTHRYLYETERQLGTKRKVSISFDESNLGRENTMTAVLSSHQAGVTAWLLPMAASPPTFSPSIPSAVLETTTVFFHHGRCPARSTSRGKPSALEHFRPRHGTSFCPHSCCYPRIRQK